ncbi:hypothetical protein EDC19_0554 [Natranaerovirga hydrolytica]|uniref:Nickel transport protein n=1 Tax=Natranaerovirga hydrolytica TaxID=680378 RepID=A0A4R1MY48_9FIRM|nr:hypothetical protein [Natranaerovirga hydrolytica]TCK98136.1 hypothetical protein EDC19_0554 [Natranaerovirga hydrolytica]
MNVLKKLILLIVIFSLSSTVVYGHRMLIEPIEDGMVKVYYADGSFSNTTQVMVYDTSNNLIVSERVNDEGYFDYASYSDAHKLVADDGLGHRVEWQVGDPISYSSSFYYWLKIVIVVVIIIGIGLIFYIRQKRS